MRRDGKGEAKLRPGGGGGGGGRTVHEERRGRDLVAAVLVGQGGGLLDGREVLGGGRRVDVAHLDARRRRRLDVALR